MLRPEFRDKHGEIDSYAFFISTFINNINAELGSS